MDLAVDSPEAVADVLREAAEQYRESAAELESAWQEKAAGRPWTQIAGLLDGCADRIEKAVGR